MSFGVPSTELITLEAAVRVYCARPRTEDPLDLATALMRLRAAINALGTGARNETITPDLVRQGLWSLKQETLGGTVPTATLTNGFFQIDGGTVKGIAIMTKERSPALPNLPTAPEQGTTGAESYTWSAILLPKGAPAAIVTRLNGAIVQAMKTPAVREALEKAGAQVVPDNRATPQYLGEFVRSEIEKWAAPIKASGVSVE